MPVNRAYVGQRRPKRSEATRERIVGAVRELLEEGRFHESTVEEVADRAGIARATLYQHFDSRLGLVDAICDTFDANPALLSLRDSVELEDVDAALVRTIADAARFWASESAILEQLYGAAALDPAARDLVDRQGRDRRGEMSRLAARLHRAGRLRPGTGEKGALTVLMLLTSFESFRELRREGLSEKQAATSLCELAEKLLLAPR